MSVKNIRIASQWERPTFSAVVMLGFLVISNNSNGDATHGAGSSVPPTSAKSANTPVADNVPHTALNTGTSNPKNNSVVFRKKGRSANKAPDCGSKVPCDSKKYVFRSKRPDDKDVGMGVSANNNQQAAKVRVKVPF